MKAEILIPVGYRRLKHGEVIKLGDRWFNPNLMEWLVLNYEYGDVVNRTDYPTIRPVKSPSPKSKKNGKAK